MQDLIGYVEELGKSARRASQQLVTLDGATKVAALRKIAEALRDNTENLLAANAEDIKAAEAAKLDPPLVHRLRLDAK
jgi:glutamate-5-semialdehyde dehydrogenase